MDMNRALTFVFATISFHISLTMALSLDPLGDLSAIVKFGHTVNRLEHEQDVMGLQIRDTSITGKIREKRIVIHDPPSSSLRPVCLNNGNELCCGKKVYHGQFDYRAQCCGNDIFDTSTARCCDGIVQINDDQNFQCCGKKLYDQRTQVCCNGNAHDVKGNEQCCDTVVYDPVSKICCNGTLSDIDNKILSCCLKEAYEPATAHCFNNVVQKKSNADEITQVCGTQVIDYKTKVCCDNEPLDRANDFTLCCGKTTVSASTQLCCNGTVISDPKDGEQCCEKKVYNPATQVCCKGKVITRPENSVGTFDYCNPIIFNSLLKGASYSPYFGCCGDQLITNDTIQLCCNDKLYTFNETPSTRYEYGCCGSERYQPSKKTCCVDTLVSGPNQLCCGKRLYDLNKKLCCADKVYDHDGVPPNTCCSQVQPDE